MALIAPPQGFQVSGSSGITGPIRIAAGTAGAPSYSLSAQPTLGLYAGTNFLGVALNGTGKMAFDLSGSLYQFVVGPSVLIGWSSADDAWGNAIDVALVRDGAAAILALKNGINAQEFRVYGTTTGPKYLAMKNDGTSAIIMKFGAGGTLTFIANASQWNLNDSGVLYPQGGNANDLGDSTNTVRTGYFGTSIGIIGTVSGTGVLAVGNGTAPTAQVDTVALYSTDDAAGHTIPSFFCEGTNVLAAGQADSASSVRVKMRINGTVVTLLAI